jgi:hypothetical protein
MAPLQPSPAVESTIPPGHRARLHGGESATPAREFCCVLISVLFRLIAPMVIFRWLGTRQIRLWSPCPVTDMVAIAPAGGSSAPAKGPEGCGSAGGEGSAAM